MKMMFLQLRIAKYRDYKKFDNNNFTEDLLFRLAVANTEANDTSFPNFLEICQQTINHNAPYKQKQLLGRQSLTLDE